MKVSVVNSIFTGLTAAVAAALLLASCANPNKAKDLETKLENNGGKVSANTSVGVKDGNLVVQKKVEMNEELRRLQNEVFSLEDRVYGNRKYGSKGLYGTLKKCRRKLVSKEMGGDGKLMWTEPLERVTDKEDTWDVGIDEEEKIVGVSEEFLKDRLGRFKKYKKVLMKRQDEYEDKMEICTAKIDAKKSDMARRQQLPPPVE